MRRTGVEREMISSQRRSSRDALPILAVEAFDAFGVQGAIGVRR
jgi:hypothetical protein